MLKITKKCREKTETKPLLKKQTKQLMKYIMH